MIRIGICDDEATARDALRFQLENIIDEKNEQIVYEFSSGNTAAKWLKTHPGEIDLLFLDVEMPKLNGMETAMEIRTFNSDILLVFVTGYSDYVFEGYKVNALDYILKPANTDRINQLMTRVRQAMKKQEEDYFVFHNTDGTYRFLLSDILYFYSVKRQVYLVTANKEYPFYDKLDHIEEQLDYQFVRIHQRYLVNPLHVGQIGSTSVTIGEQNLPISRSLKDTATRKLALSLLK